MAVIRQQHYEVLPVGEYQARIREVESAEGQFGPQLKFRFDLEGGQYAGREMLGWCSATFSPKSKLYAWTRAAFGREIPADYDLDTRHLIGKPVRLVLVTKTGDDGTEYNRIDSVKSARPTPSGNGNGSSSPAPAPAPQPVTVNEGGGPDWPETPPPDDAGGWPF